MSDQNTALAVLDQESEVDTCTLVLVPKITEETSFAMMPVGGSLADILGPDAAYSFRVLLNGEECLPALWPDTYPAKNSLIWVEFYPQGGGGARKWILTIVAIVAIIFSYGAASGFAWAAIAGVSTTTVAIGAALVAGLALAMIPPPSMPSVDAAGGAGNTLSSITGTSNNVAPYAVIPLVVGEYTFFPSHAALPYTEVVGKDQYLRMLLDLGYGDLDISDISIGTTDINSYDDVQYEITKTPTLFTHDIYELSVGASLKDVGATVTRSTQTNVTEISLDIVISGLAGTDKKGKLVRASHLYSIQYRATGSSGAWIDVANVSGVTLVSFSRLGGNIQASSMSRDTLRAGVHWAVPSGRYDVKVEHLSSDFSNSTIGDPGSDSQWTVLRSISPQLPSTTGTLKLAVRIKATDQLNGVISTLKVRAAQKIRRWNKSTQSWLLPTASTNPAWIYLWVLTECPGTIRHVPVDRVDLDGIADWAADCNAKGLVYGGVLDSVKVTSEFLKDLMACGLGTFGIRRGLYSVVRDLPQSVPMQMYTPINGTGLKWSRVFTEPPHALRVAFTNPQQSNQLDERIVYWNGYNAGNATHFEKLNLKSIIDPGAAWVIARYHLAVMWLRPNIYTQDVDLEYLRNERGDLVEVSSPMLGWGVSYGRLKTVSGTVLTLNTPFAVKAGKSYAIRVRTTGTFSEERYLTYNPADVVEGEISKVTMTTSLPGVGEDKLYVIGEVSNMTMPLLITGIKPSGSMIKRTATLTLVDSNPGVWAAMQGTPPPFVSNITNTPWCAAPPPPVVSIRAGDSAPNDAGVVEAAPGVAGAPKPGVVRMPLYGGGCPVIDAEVWFVTEEGLVAGLAGTVKVGDIIRGADPVTLEPIDHEVTFSEEYEQPCVELNTESGHTLKCSVSAPIPDSEQKGVLAPNTFGKMIAVQLIAEPQAKWSTVVHLRGIGRQKIQHISIDGGCFWADGILHHNKAPRPRGADSISWQ